MGPGCLDRARSPTPARHEPAAHAPVKLGRRSAACIRLSWRAIGCNGWGLGLRLQVSKGGCTCERMSGRWTPLLCGVCSMVLRMMLPHHCPHPETGPTDERVRMCTVCVCAAVGRLCVRKCAADAGEPSGSGSTHPIRSIEQQQATSDRPSARQRRLTASQDGPH